MKDLQLQERLKRLLSYLEHDKHNAALLADIAALQFADGQIDSAQASALQAITFDANRHQAHTVLGLIAATRQDFDGAAAALTTAIALGEIAPTAFYHHAQALAMLGRFAEAETSAEAAARSAQELPYAPALYVRVLHYLGKTDEAIAYAESVREAGITAPKLNGMLSTLYVDDEKIDQARACAQAALAEDREDADAHTTLGLLALADLDGDAASASFERVLRMQTHHGRATLGRGLGHMLAGDLAAATQALEKATQSTNMRDHIGTWQTLAWCYILQNDIEAAERTLQQALELDRNFAETHGGLAIVALMRGDILAAQRSAKRATALDGKNFSGNFAQSLLQQAAGNPKQASAVIKQLLAQPLLPGGKNAQTAIAEMLARNAAGRNTTLH